MGDQEEEKSEKEPEDEEEAEQELIEDDGASEHSIRKFIIQRSRQMMICINPNILKRRKTMRLL